MRKIFLWLVLLAACYFLISPAPTYACSGYPYFGVEDLPSAEILVRATVIEADDRGYSAIFRVEEYYKGEGNRFLPIMRFPPALETGALIRGYDTSCLYAGIGQSLYEGSQGYFGLISNGDGTFSDYIGGTAHFFPVDGNIYYQEGATEGYAVEMDDELVVTEEEFIDLMLEAGDREAPIPPQSETPNFFPHMRFLNLTTESGRRYTINPDRSISEMPENAPLAISPDGAHLAFQHDEDSIAFQYIWTEYEYTDDFLEENPDRVNHLIVDGQAASFSSENNLVAVWNQQQLTIYMLFNDGGSIWYDYGSGISLHTVAQHDFAESESESLPKILWSANGTTLVWQEASGIWHWNIFDQANPQLLIASDSLLLDVPSQLMVGADDLSADFSALLEVSAYGRFVRYGSQSNWQLLDTRTGQNYANLLVSPNELYFVAINDASSNASASVMEDENYCTPPLRENCQAQMNFENLEFSTAFPFQMELLGTVACDEDGVCNIGGYSWNPAIGRTQYIGGRNFRVSISDFQAIHYDAQYQIPAILVGDYQVYFGFYWDDWVSDEDVRPYLDIVDLEGLVDSPIVSIEWGQPLFFDSYMLTTIEHQP